MSRHRKFSPAGLVLGILTVMAIMVLIQAVAAAVGWGVLALIAAIYIVRRGRRR